MKNPTSKFFLAAMVAGLTSAHALAQDYTNNPDYSEMDHSDFISLNAGDANKGNLAIQMDDPAPSYVNKTHIHSKGVPSQLVMEEFFARHAKQDTPQTVINIGTPQQ